jgi:hypothetical protein
VGALDRRELSYNQAYITAGISVPWIKRSER